MNQHQCALCSTSISDTKSSEEHIIPQSIGGRKVVHRLLCHDCNSKAGHTWDTTLANQLMQICVFLNISRQKPLPGVTVDTVDGRQLLLNPDGSTANRTSAIRPKKTADTIEMSNVPPHLLRSQLKAIRRSHRIEELRIDHGFDFQSNTYSLNWHIGGVDASRSIMKTAMALAVDAGIDASAYNIAQRFLVDSSVACSSCIGFFYSDERDIVADRPVPVLHCVAVRGDPKTRQLIGYVEYFSAFRMIAILSDTYDGTDIAHSYTIDPLDGVELKIDVRLSFTPDEIRDILLNGYYDERVRFAAANSLAAIASKRRRSKEDEYMANEIVRNAASKLHTIDEDSLNILNEEVLTKCKEYILHNAERFLDSRDEYRQFQQHLASSFITTLRTIAENDPKRF